MEESDMILGALAGIAGLWLFLVVIPYLVFFITVCVMGSDREIGGFLTFLGCLFMSPFLMVWVVSLSERKSDVEFKERMIRLARYKTE